MLPSFFFFLFFNYFKVAFTLNGLYENKDVMKEEEKRKEEILIEET